MKFIPYSTLSEVSIEEIALDPDNDDVVCIGHHTLSVNISNFEATFPKLVSRKVFSLLVDRDLGCQNEGADYSGNAIFITNWCQQKCVGYS